MKICPLDDSGVGKTAIREAYISKNFPPLFINHWHWFYSQKNHC